MKKIIQTTIVLLTINTSIMAQKGFKLEKEITVNVSTAELWEMIGPGFIEVYKWSSNVDHAEGGGQSEFDGATCSERFCDVNVKGFNKISEKLTKYNDEQMNLAYEVTDGMPGFITAAVNDWTVVSVNGNQSKLIMKAKFESKGLMGGLTRGMMKKKMTETLETVLNDAKIYAETGQISEAKKARIAELQKKNKMAA
ncbi:MAG: SRPBCC family protein [Vicingaceae bacterium]